MSLIDGLRAAITAINWLEGQQAMRDDGYMPFKDAAVAALMEAEVEAPPSYEWAIWSVNAQHIHRGPWPVESEARKWMKKYEEQVSQPPFKFKVVRRLIPSWEEP